MEQQPHIINEQIIEMHIPKTSDAFAMQQKLSRLYREQLVPIIDKQLSNRYGGDEKSNCQIDKLTIDLGEVQIGEIAKVFTEKFARAIASHKVQEVSKVREQVNNNPRKTPLKLVSHYLMTGILPWWAGNTTKTYLLEQFEALLKSPDDTFKELLGQFRHHSVYLDRFLNTFTEEQILRSLQLLTSLPVNGLSGMKDKLMEIIRKNPGEWSRRLTDLRIAKALWAAVFDRIGTAKDASELKIRSIRQALQALGAGPEVVERWSSLSNAAQNPEKEAIHTELFAVRSLIATLKTQYPDNRVWQRFFQYVSKVLHRSSVPLPDVRLLREFKQLLTDLKAAQNKSMPPGAKTGPDTGSKAVTETQLQPLANQLHVLETVMRQMQTVPTPDVIEKLRSGFEDTDFIPVQNAGLVILWPFLQRFFENLELITGKAFQDEAARNKAACTLQYLSEEEEAELFEGNMILNKVLCGIPPEDTVEPVWISTREKEIAEGLLQAVILRGPHWKNLSPEGFRASYVRREGLLCSRDGHWLLQVKKETYDVTLEKLPWGFAAVKLPWMPSPLMVEWI